MSSNVGDPEFVARLTVSNFSLPQIHPLLKILLVFVFKFPASMSESVSDAVTEAPNDAKQPSLRTVRVGGG